MPRRGLKKERTKWLELEQSQVQVVSTDSTRKLNVSIANTLLYQTMLKNTSKKTDVLDSNIDLIYF
jgi:hypothetical protein